jgi:chloramphenicol-sensitive protein RarD
MRSAGAPGFSVPLDPWKIATVEMLAAIPSVVYGMWGIFPLYFHILEPAGALEILVNRIVWSTVFCIAAWFVLRDTSWIRPLLAVPHRVMLLAVAAVVLSVNWGAYIYAVSIERVVETSLGYFINPLVTVLMGVIVLHERLRPVQWVAVGLAVLAVAILTVDYGRPPWIALTLAFSFATYGLIKKKANVGAAESLGIETAILFIPALTFLIVLHGAGNGAFGQLGLRLDLLLIAAGIITAIPLLFFGAAATRIPLTTLGLLQYLAPIIQFALGVLVFGEDVPPVRLVGFALVWTALIILTAETIAHRRKRVRLAIASTSRFGERQQTLT